MKKEKLSKEEIWNRIGGFFTPLEKFKNDFGEYKSLLKFYDGRPVRTPSDWQERRQEILKLFENGHDLHELHALMSPRPFFVSGGSEDPPSRWKALNHTILVNNLLGYENRVGMSNTRSNHSLTPETNEETCLFFEYFLT